MKEVEETRSASEDSYSIVAQFYDFVGLYRSRADIDFFVTLALESSGPVLEVGCGTGRVLIPTARAGIKITGLDKSTAMLGVLREKLAQESPEVRARVNLVEADMRSFDFGRKFALITTPFRPFQHLLTVEDQLACLRSIRRHLAQNGRMVLDLFNPDFRRLAALVEDPARWEEEPEFSMPDGRKVIRRIRVASEHPLDQIFDLELNHDVTYPDGREERISQRLQTRYFFRYEVAHLLKLAGFQVENVYAGFDKSPLGSTYPGELIYVATLERD